MAYLHVAIPLNISTFEQQISIFHTYLNKLTEITTPAAKQVPFTKAIRDLAAFAKSRLSTLQTSLRFVDTILPEDTSQSAQARNKRFIGVTPLMIYTLIQDLRYKQQQSYDGDLFFPNGTFKFENSSDPLLRPQRSVPPTLPFFTTNKTSGPPPQPNHNREKRYLPDITPFFITRFYMANLEIIRKHEGIRRQWQMYNYTKHLNSLHTTTTESYPDYPEFHEVFLNETYPGTTTPTPDISHFHALLNHTTEPPPFVHVPAEPHPDPHLYDQLIRQRRQVIAGLGAVAGVLGTFLGLFNELEISSIRSQMGTLQSNQNILLHISHTHEQQIQLLHAELTHLASVINLLIQYNPALVYAKLHAQIQLVQDRLQVLQDCVQQLQHQRLAVTLLDLNQLHHMYSSVTKMAQSKGYTLLPSKPQDFFQLDTSYVRTGANVLILLHVPCLTDNYLLTIYKFANLPYPVNSFHTSTNNSNPDSQLTPIHTVHDLLTSFNQPDLYSTSSEALFFLPESDLIAIGRNDGVSNRYKLLSHSDLAGCIQRNHVYLCEHHQVLRTDLEGSCLGSLYLQSERGVRENCRLDKRPLRETVYQLSATDHLIVSPIPHTAQILCKNGSHFPIRLKLTSRVTVPPACSLRLFNHTINSDDSVRIKPEPLQFSWSFNPLLLPSEIMQQAAHADNEMNDIKDQMTEFKNNTLSQKDFPEAVTNSLSTVSHFSVLFWITFSIAILALGLLICWYCGSRRQFRKRNQQQPEAYELPDTISEIARLNVNDPELRRKENISAPPYHA